MLRSQKLAILHEEQRTFIRQFGNPKEKIKTGRTYELWTFGLTMNDYLEVNVRENKVIAIKALAILHEEQRCERWISAHFELFRLVFQQGKKLALNIR
jgi:hypothetical protein